MIAKCIKGKGFRGAVAYDLQPDKSILLETNMAAGEEGSVKDFTAEFAAIRALRPQLSKAVCHVSLSLHPDEKLTDAQWCEVGHAWLVGMGFTNNQFILSRHTDTEHPHIHILVNRIALDGSVVSDSHDYKRQETIMRRLEKEYGLVQVPNSKEVGRKAPTKGEVEHVLRTQEPSARTNLQTIIDTVLDNKQLPLPTFMRRLAAEGVEVKLNQASTGTISGISFAMDGVAFKGSQLGKAYTWKSLQQRGLQYENRRITQHEKGQERTFERTGNLGTALRPAQSTRTREAEKQQRIAKNFERLEQEYHRGKQRDSTQRSRGTQLSR